MKISLIMPTINRYDEVKRFIMHLNRQTFRDFELIIVDQNNDNRICEILQTLSPNYDIRVLKSERGVSKARNIGLKHFKGEIVAFPDDDCWYPHDLLGNVNKFFSKNYDCDGLSSCCRDNRGKISVLRFDVKHCILNKYNMWRNCLIITIFFKSNLIRDVGYFIENIGPGTDSIFGSGEDYDYILRSLSKGFKLYYDPSIYVNHQEIFNYDDYNESDLKKTYKYAMSNGRLLNIYYSKLYFIYRLLIKFKAILISIIFLRFKKTKILWHTLCAKIRGGISPVEIATGLKANYRMENILSEREVK